MLHSRNFVEILLLIRLR